MDNIVAVEVFQSIYNLNGEALCHHLVDLSLSLDVVVQGVVLAELKQDVDVGSVLKDVLKVYDIYMLECTVNLNFAQKLGTLSTLRQSLLRYNFSSSNFLGL